MAFKERPEEERRSVRVPILFTQKENETVRHFASIRVLNLSDFIRRAALGRKADVRYESQIILELRAVVDALRQVNKTYISQGMEPPQEDLKTLFQEAIEAMRRISK